MQETARKGSAPRPLALEVLAVSSSGEPERTLTGVAGLDRVLGGGLVAGSVVLLAGEPGIGKSTLLLQALAGSTERDVRCLLVSGEESAEQVSARATRLGLGGDIPFTLSRDLPGVLDQASSVHPQVLAIDSIQTLRDPAMTGGPGGPAQVRACADALVATAKAEGITIVLTGHVTKDGDVAGPRTLEHAVDVILSFEGDPRSGLRLLSSGKNRFGSEGEVGWFQMTSRGLCEIDPSGFLVPSEREAGAAVAVPRTGRRAIAVEVQALVGSPDGPPRRQVTGLDPRRFGMVAAVLDRAIGRGLGKAELFGATAGGARVDEPAADLAMAAALASASSGSTAPEGAAFAGEVALTGQVRPVAGLEQRAAAASAVGCTVLFCANAEEASGIETVRVRTVRDALTWAVPRVARGLSA
jgi:DNA repair protein RadA/Sms